MAEAAVNETPETKVPANIHEALMLAQAEFPAVVRNKEGFNYKYPTLDSIIDAVTPALAKYGLLLVTPCHKGDASTIVTAELYHVHTGAKITSDMEAIPVVDTKKSIMQNYGAAITYARRYVITALLNIAVEDDTDAREEERKGAAAKKPDNRNIDKKKADDRGKWDAWSKKYVETLAGFTKLSDLHALAKDATKNNQLRTLSDLHPDLFSNIELARTANALRLGAQPLASDGQELGY